MTGVPPYFTVVTFDRLPPEDALLTAVVTALLLLLPHVSLS